MFDFDITPDSTNTKTTKAKTTKTAKKAKRVASTVHTVIDELMERNDELIEKKLAEIEVIKKQTQALKTKTDMEILLAIRRDLAKATILKKPDEAKSAERIAKLIQFDSVLNIDKSSLDPFDIYYFNKVN